MVTHLFADGIEDASDDEDEEGWASVSAADAIDLRYGFPFPESLPNEELVAAAEAVFEAEGDVALQYLGGEYADRLDGVIAARERERGVACEAENVAVTSGSTHAIDLVCRVFLDPGDVVFTEAPTFMAVLDRFEDRGAAVSGLPVDENGLDVEAVADELAAREARGEPLPKLLYTIPTFHNPTGTTLPAARRRRLLDLAAQYDFVVLEDDAYGDLRYDGERVPPLAALDEAGRVVRVSTFSKTIAPGVRTGWVVADDAVVARVDRLNAGGVNRFTKAVVSRYVADGGFEAALDGLRASYARRRDRLLDALDGHLPEATWSEPDGGFFVWVTLPEDLDSAALLPVAVDEGVAYLPGAHFSPAKEESSSLRLAFSHAPPDDIERGVAALARATRAATE